MEYRSLEASEIEPWLDHCGRVFAPLERAYFARHFHGDPTHDHRDILVAVEDGRIISALRVFTRQISIQGQVLSMGGIGEVATAPEGQGKGLAGTLLERALALMAERGMVISALFGVHSNYKRLGWQSVPLALQASRIPDKAVPCPADWHCRPMEVGDLPALANLHQTYNRSHDGWIVRSDPRYWQDWFWIDPSEKWLACSADGEIKAYLAAASKPGESTGIAELMVRDFAALPEALSAFPALVAAVSANIAAATKPAIVRYPACIQSALPVLETSHDDSLMYRLITPFQLGKQHIATTTELAAALQPAPADPLRSLTFWYLDGF